MKVWRKIFHANGDQKKVGVAILISDKIHFEIKAMKIDKGHYIMIKGSIQEDITIINIYAPNMGVPQYVRQMLTSMKGEINNNTTIVGDFNTLLFGLGYYTRCLGVSSASVTSLFSPCFQAVLLLISISNLSLLSCLLPIAHMIKYL